jgi:hypothetical protein
VVCELVVCLLLLVLLVLLLPLAGGPASSRRGASPSPSGTTAAPPSSAPLTGGRKGLREREDTPLMNEMEAAEVDVAAGNAVGPGSRAAGEGAGRPGLAEAGAGERKVHRERMAVISTDPTIAERAPYANPMYK